jgi:hypothetical protein
MAVNRKLSTRFRLPFLFVAILCLFVGLLTGLNRIGWSVSLSGATSHHGAIMVGGFLGTLIGLEKVIPLKRKFLFFIPFLSGSSIVFFLAGQSLTSFVCIVIASAGLCIVLIYYLYREKSIIYALMAAGAACWLVGNLLLMTTSFYPMSFPWWLGFGLLIVTAERLELSKFLPVRFRMKALLVGLLAAYVCGLLLSFHGAGVFISAASLVGVAIWLLRFDIIGISMRKDGLPRFVAMALTCGYVSLLGTGVLMLSLDNEPLAYDAVVHSFFIGFIFSMIFAHGPIILPGVVGITVKPYHKILYLWLIRICGDIILDFSLRKHSGYITALAILGYLITIASLTGMTQRRHAKVL